MQKTTRYLLGVFQKKKHDVVIFGIISYRYRKQRPQHIAEHLADHGYRVFYVENGFVPVAEKLESQYDLPVVVKQYAHNLFLVSLVATRDVSIYKDELTLEDKKSIFLSFDELQRRMKIRRFVSIVEHPFWAQIALFLDAPVLYDCMDEHSGFLDTAKHIVKLEDKLISKVNTVVVTSASLEKKMRKRGVKQLSVIKNAGEYTYFSQVTRRSFAVPVEVASLPHPIVGYYGAISTWFDAAIIAKLAEQRKDISIVLIGEVTSPQMSAMAAKYKNVHLLGEKSYSTLLPFVQQFDVCIIPFKLLPLTLATNPVKIFEYFATGKPVVSTRLPEIQEYQHLVYFANSPKEFVGQVNKALEENDLRKRLERQEVARQNTWGSRGRSFESELARLGSKTHVD